VIRGLEGFNAREENKHAIDFDRLDRRAYIFPNLVVQRFALFTVPTRGLNGGEIRAVGIVCRQWDWFADQSYLFMLQQNQPITYQLASNDDRAGAAASEVSSYAYTSIGTLDNPKPLYIPLQAGNVFSLLVRARAGVPATGFRVANLYVRTIGQFYRQTQEAG
jgi:hypothetical protein